MRTLWLAVLLAACSKPADKVTADPPPAPAPAPSSSAPAPAGSAHHRKHEDRREPVVADAPPLKLDVVAHGATTTWQADAFARVARYTLGNDGEARDVWSLRELAHQLAGPTARVVKVTGDDSQTVDAAAWDDPQRTPILHTTRRGTLKFRWADAAGKWGESSVKDVTRIELAP